MLQSYEIQRNLPSIGAAVRNIIIFISVLSIPLTISRELGLSAVETSSWIMAIYGLPGLFSIVLAIRYRQPILFTGNLFMLIFISGLGDQYSLQELIGVSIVAGAVVVLMGILGLSRWLATWIPLPIMFGLLTGSIVPFVSNVFTILGDDPFIVVGTLSVYVLSRLYVGNRLPAILPALVSAFIIALITGQFGQLSEPLTLVLPELTLPVFSLTSIITATPVFIVLITLQANLPSVRFLQSQDYDPPETMINLVSGVGTMLGSLLGPTGVSLSLPATSVVAGEGAGAPEIRHRSIYMVSIAALLLGTLAGIAAGLVGLIPSSLLVTLAGLSLVDVLTNAIQRVADGPLLLGPVFAFAIALSNISFLGFGNYFWSLVIGAAVSLLLERDEFLKLREKADVKNH